MTKARSSNELMNLDVLALSLLCCLLASVVGVLVLSGEVSAEASVEQGENPELWIRLRQQTTQLYTQVQDVERSREGIVAKLNHSVLQRENLVLESKIRDIQEKLTLIDKIHAARSETVRLSKELEDEEKSRNSTLTPEARRMLGEYKGPYVLLECVEDGAIVYPGKQRIEMKPSKEQTDQLITQIAKAGFVAIVVRPSGWYGNSFDNLRKTLYERLDQMEKDTSKYIGRSTFPLSADDPITNYIPAEIKR